MPPISAAERMLHFVGRPLVRVAYRITPFAAESLPAGGFLLLPNHITWVDAVVLQAACPRPIRYIIAEEFYRNRLLHPFLRTTGCIPITARRAKEAVRLAAEHIVAGEVVCVFP